MTAPVAKQREVRARTSAPALLLLDALGILPLGKQDEENPLDRDEFTRRLLALAATLQRTTSRNEAKAIRDFAELAERDWPDLSAAERGRAIRRLRNVIDRIPVGLRSRMTDRIEVEALRMERRARDAARRKFNLDIPTRAPRPQIARAVRLLRPTFDFVEDEFSRRAERFNDLAALAIAGSISRGAEAKEITERLTREATALIQRPDYYTAVSGAVLNRARTNAVLGAFTEAKIAKYRVVAVLDEKTCIKCRFMHNTIFTVSSGQAILNSVAGASSPQAIARANPFLRQGRDRAGNQIIYILGPGGSRIVVARVTQNAEGTVGERGRFGKSMSPQQLAKAKLGPPPYHPICRCDVEPA